MLVKTVPQLSNGLPKTGQIISYQSGDDGDLEVGWWQGRLNANNRTRFKPKAYVAMEPVILDFATGLMWPYDGSGASCNSGNVLNWAAAIDFALTLDFGGFSDWRVPNLREILSICSQGLQNPSTYPTFFNTLGPPYYQYWSSTTYIGDTSKAWVGNLAHGNAGTIAKTNSVRIRPVRWFA